MAVFCVVGDFVAEDAKRRTGTGGGPAVPMEVNDPPIRIRYREIVCTSAGTD
jgi:hypothetical protein